MYGASPDHYPSQRNADEAYDESGTVLREISLEQLSGVFQLIDILAIDMYQRQTSLGRLTTKPLPEEILLKYGVRSNMLEDNTSTYDDEGEDMLFEDNLICDIVEARRGDTNNRELTALLRVRRSVVAFILFNWDSLDEGEQPLRAS